MTTTIKQLGLDKKTEAQVRELAKQVLQMNVVKNEAEKLYNETRSTLLAVCQDNGIDATQIEAVINGKRQTLSVSVAASQRSVVDNQAAIERIGQAEFNNVATVSQKALEHYLTKTEIQSIVQTFPGNINVTVKVSK